MKAIASNSSERSRLPWGNRRYLKYVLNAHRSTIGKHEIILTHEGIIERTPIGESRFHWQAIQEVESDANDLAIFTDLSSCIWIPLRTFSSEQERNEFITEVNNQRNTAW